MHRNTYLKKKLLFMNFSKQLQITENWGALNILRK